MTTNRQRLDEVLVARGLVPSRARARDAVRRGVVTVDGRTAVKAGQPVATGQPIAILDESSRFVSRGALKLAAALDVFGLDPAGRVALDLGASTGGFTQVLLERGAARVYAVDVGRDQLHPELRADPRAISHEGVNARDLGATHVPEPVQAIVADVSFISLCLALPPALKLAGEGAWGVFLVKPQFEVGREHIGKGGIVRDETAAQGSAEAVARWLGEEQGWATLGLLPSPIAGGDGNREFLLGARRLASERRLP